MVRWLEPSSCRFAFGSLLPRLYLLPRHGHFQKSTKLCPPEVRPHHDEDHTWATGEGAWSPASSNEEYTGPQTLVCPRVIYKVGCTCQFSGLGQGSGVCIFARLALSCPTRPRESVGPSKRHVRAALSISSVAFSSSHVLPLSHLSLPSWRSSPILTFFLPDLCHLPSP